jgi:hypothetical protein
MNKRTALRCLFVSNLPKGPKRGWVLDEVMKATVERRRKWKTQELGGPRGWLLWTMFLDNWVWQKTTKTS